MDAEQWARIEDRDRRFREMMRRWGPRRPPRGMRDLRNEDRLRDGRKGDHLPPGGWNSTSRAFWPFGDVHGNTATVGYRE